MINKNKHKIVKKVVIILLVVVFAIGVYLLVAHQKSFWPFYNASQNQQIQNAEESAGNGTPQNSYRSSPIDSPTTTNSSDANVYDSKYTDGKTPVQYEGQTDSSGTYNGTNNEQFRIPEDEL